MTSRAPDRAARAFSAVVRGVTLSDRKMISRGHGVGLSVEARVAPKSLASSKCYSQAWTSYGDRVAKVVRDLARG
jgi:hypothetical protein